MKITKKRLRQMLREEGYYDKLPKTHADGHPWPGSLQDLAKHQGRTWGHGEVVDSQGFKGHIDKSQRLATGRDKSPLHMSEVLVRKIIREALTTKGDPRKLYDEMVTLRKENGSFFGLLGMGPWRNKKKSLSREQYEKLVQLRDTADNYNDFFFAVKAPSWSSGRHPETGTHYSPPTEFNLQPAAAHKLYNADSLPKYEEVEKAAKRFEELEPLFQRVNGTTEEDHMYGRKREDVIFVPTGDRVTSSVDRKGSLGS